MASRDTPVAEVHELDLRGFRRRLPRAAIAWHVGRLGPTQLLQVALDPDSDGKSLLVAIRCCGGEVVATEEGPERRRFTVRNRGLLTVTQELDMRGARCPAPVVEARRRLRRMSPGEVLRMVSDCTGTPAEVGSWAAQSVDFALLDAWHQGARDHVFLLGRR
jgi:tRNA 2-thiouridine synthesizing protein A